MYHRSAPFTLPTRRYIPISEMWKETQMEEEKKVTYT